MRKIKIDTYIKNVADEYKQLLGSHKTEVVTALEGLIDKFNGNHIITRRGKVVDQVMVNECRGYIDRLKNDYKNDEFVLMLPDSFDKTYLKYREILTIDILGWNISIDGDRALPIHKRITEAMGYQRYVRNEIFPKLMRKIGINSCVYCNANYVVSTDDGVGFFELDHWMPTSRYPFLCTSFYNLQPCCPHCNKRKGSDTKHKYFKLYEEKNDESLDVFKFQISKSSIVRYFSLQDLSALKIYFKAVDANSQKLRDDANAKFRIEDIYNEHIDFVEEMMWRAKFYNNTILATMKWFYGKRMPSFDLSRFKLGTYADPDEVHKRPLTKMMQDVGRQLGII